MSDGNTLMINADRTVLLSIWEDGTVTVALRDTPDHLWGPPIILKLEGER